MKQSETKQPGKEQPREKLPGKEQPEKKRPRVNLEAAGDHASVIELPLLTIQTAEDQTDLGNQGEQNEQVSKSANPESLSTSIITTPGSTTIQSECSTDFGSEQQRQDFVQCHLGMGNQNEGEGTSHVFHQESQSLTNNDGSNSQDQSGAISSISSQKPKGWEVLGWVDAELTKNYLDTFKQQTHKLCIHPNFYELFRDTRVQRLFYRLKMEYELSFDYVEYKPIPSFSNPRKYEYGLFNALPCEPFNIIPEVVGFVEKILIEDITPEREFSILSKSEIYKYCRIMLGPVSFVNYSCRPNCRYFVGGETKNKLVVRLESIEKIAVGNELAVHYGDDYFEESACHCEFCKRDSVVSLPVALEPDIIDLMAPTIEEEEKEEELNLRDENFLRHQQSENLHLLGSLGMDTITEETQEELNFQNTNQQQSCNRKKITSPQEDSLSEKESNEDDEYDGEEGTIDQVNMEKACGRKVKYSKNPDCLICHKKTTRIDRHLVTHSSVINKKEIQFLKDFYRTKHGPQNTKVFDCHLCFRRFVSIPRHKDSSKCDGTEIRKVESFYSKT